MNYTVLTPTYRLEREIDKTLKEAYPAVKRMLMIVGADRVERVAHCTKYNFTITEKPVKIAGVTLFLLMLCYHLNS